MLNHDCNLKLVKIFTPSVMPDSDFIFLISSSLARILSRDFKSVSDDIKLLERFGFIELVSERTGKRKRLKPVIIIDQVTINVKV